jgi:hypothetical protein
MGLGHREILYDCDRLLGNDDMRLAVLLAIVLS